MVLNRARFGLPLAISIALHLALGVVATVRRADRPPTKRAPMRIELSRPFENPSATAGSRSRPAFRKRIAAKAIDLRPSYMRGGSLATAEPASGAAEERGSEAISRELLQGDPKIASAFDGLAARIDHFVDYPSILIENGVQGVAALDLYFDSQGEVDEGRSRFSGDHRALRGVLARASRKGIEAWYLGEGSKLAKEQFRNQHFRAEFSLTYLDQPYRGVDREALGSYRIVRRHQVSTCAQPMGVDLACLAMKGYGLAQKHLSEDYKGRAMAVIDVLEQYDERGLSGINDRVRRSRGKI